MAATGGQRPVASLGSTRVALRRPFAPDTMGTARLHFQDRLEHAYKTRLRCGLFLIGDWLRWELGTRFDWDQPEEGSCGWSSFSQVPLALGIVPRREHNATEDRQGVRRGG